MTEIDLWTDKYRPRRVSDITGQKEVIRKFESWIQRYQDGNDPNIERCVLLTGQSGLGKSSSAMCLLEQYGYTVKEFNASDVRTKAQVEESLYNLIDVKPVIKGKPIAIIMDEIDGMSGGDKGGLSELIRYINPNRGKGNRKKEDQEKMIPIPPIVCICNNITDKKLQDFRKDCLELKFDVANKDDLLILLKKICQAEKLKLDELAEELVVDYAQNDYRRLINYLQSIDSLLVDNNVVLGVEEIEQCNYIIGEKSMDMDLVEGVKHLITHKELTPRTSLEVYNNHKSQFICSIYENYTQLIATSGKTTGNSSADIMKKIQKMGNVIDDIARSDMVDKIMHKNQLWYLHKVHGLLSCHLPVTELQTDHVYKLNYSSSWSKFNLQKCNEKDIYNLSSTLKTVTGTTDVQILSQIILHNLLDSNDDEKIERGIKLLKGYGLDCSDIKTLIKIDRLSEHKKYTAKIERILKQHFPSKSDSIVRKK